MFAVFRVIQQPLQISEIVPSMTKKVVIGVKNTVVANAANVMDIGTKTLELEYSVTDRVAA